MSNLRVISLPNTDISTTNVGFGCNALLTDTLGRGDGLALLHTAYELGVRHFDVARSYCGGEAEYLLGEFAQGRRDQITITTKFRVNNSGVMRAENPAKQWVRRYVAGSNTARRVKPLIKQILGRGGAASQTVVETALQQSASAAELHEPVNLALARQSVETSLRELKTDFVDLLFVHEGTLADCQSPGLRELLETLRTEGKIRAFGVGSSFERVRAICETEPSFASIYQFESSALNPHVAALRGLHDRASQPATLSTHGAVAALGSLRDRLRQDPVFAQQFTAAFGIDASDTAALAALLLRYARIENPDGILLFRSTRQENLRANLRALTDANDTNVPLSDLPRLLNAPKTTP